MEHWELGYHGNRKCNEVDNEVAEVVFSVETGQNEPNGEWELEPPSKQAGLQRVYIICREGYIKWEWEQEPVQTWEWEQGPHSNCTLKLLPVYPT